MGDGRGSTEQDGGPSTSERSDEDDDLSERLRSVDFHDDPETARRLRMEAQRTVDKQATLLDDIDSKAIRLLRVNVLLIGLILTMLSFASRAEYTDVGTFLNVYTGIGILSLVLSSAFAAVTYTTSDLAVGVNPDDVVLLLELDPTSVEFEGVMSKSYARWIRFNERTTVRNTPLITSTVILVIAAIAYLSLGVYVALIGAVPTSLEAATHLAMVSIGVTTGIPWQVRDACLESDLIVTVIEFFERHASNPPNLFTF